jgi:phage-related protein
VEASSPLKTIVWIGSSRTDLKVFPAEVKDVMGYALYQAQLGLKVASAKPLRGFKLHLCAACVSEEIQKRDLYPKA